MVAQTSNNLFSYATKELSQDAVIMWLLNDEMLRNAFLTDLLSKDVSGNKLKNHITIDSIPRDILPGVIANPVRQHDSMDVFIVANTNDNKKVATIIEDKTDTSLHDDQVARYVKAVREDKELDCAEAEIHFVLFKTGEYTFWERDRYKQDVEKSGIVGHFYSAKDLLGFLTKNKLSSSWGKDYIEYLSSNLPKESWMTDLVSDTNMVKSILLNKEHQELELDISTPRNSRGKRNLGLSVRGIHGEPLRSADSIADIQKNYCLFPYISFNTKSNSVDIVVQYHLYYSKEIETEKGIGYIPVSRLGKNYKAWKKQCDLLKEHVKDISEEKNLGKMRVYKQTISDIDFNGDWNEIKKPFNEAIRVAKELEKTFFKG